MDTLYIYIYIIIIIITYTYAYLGGACCSLTEAKKIFDLTSMDDAARKDTERKLEDWC